MILIPCESYTRITQTTWSFILQQPQRWRWRGLSLTIYRWVNFFLDDLSDISIERKMKFTIPLKKKNYFYSAHNNFESETKRRDRLNHEHEIWTFFGFERSSGVFQTGWDFSITIKFGLAFVITKVETVKSRERVDWISHQVLCFANQAITFMKDERGFKKKSSRHERRRNSE